MMRRRPNRRANLHACLQYLPNDSARILTDRYCCTWERRPHKQLSNVLTTWKRVVRRQSLLMIAARSPA